MIVTGTFLLSLPIATSGNVTQSFVDVLFTSTSAVTTTGLIVADTGKFYSLFGQTVILVLIQICGLGYMIFIALIILGVGGRISFNSRMLLNESLARPSSIDMLKFVKVVIVFTFIIELIGA
ncbi:MAG: Trk family potassium uptake protein, partial [Candidatus Omnitrophica bacterium]|nr:Trk family potassium uptake protein [Candidatus Omnitrophota bacterium]